MIGDFFSKNGGVITQEGHPLWNALHRKIWGVGLIFESSELALYNKLCLLRFLHKTDDLSVDSE